MEYEIEVSRRDNLLRIEAFFKKVYKVNVDYGTADFFDWKIYKNCMGIGTIGVATKNGEIASTASLTLKKLWIGDKQLECAEIGDTYTDENHQRKGLFVNLISLMKKEAKIKNIQLVYGTPNAQSLPGYLKKCEFMRLEFLNVYAYSMILSLQPFFARFKYFSRALTIVNQVYRFALNLFFKIHIDKRIAIISIDKFSSEHEEYLSKVMNDYEFIFERRSDYMEWRFVQNPFQYKIFEIRKNSDLEGILVFRYSEDKSYLVLADYLFRRIHQENFSKSLFQIAENELMIGTEKIITWIDELDFVKNNLAKNLFFKRGKVEIIGHLDEKTLLEIKGKQSIHFTISDSDNI